MIEKQDFIEKLKSALSARGVSDTDMRPYIERFDKFFDRMISESSKNSAALGDVEGIADNISAQIAEKKEDIESLTEATVTIDTVKQDAEALSEATADAAAVQAAYELESTAITDIADAADMYDDYELVEEAEVLPIISEEILNAEADSYGDMQGTGGRLPDYVEEDPVPNPRIFWILFGVSLPITIPLALAGLLVFAVLWGAVMAVMLAAVAALVAVAGGGAAVSLVGIIYGVAQLFSSVSVGLYEIGLGVAAAGVAMFAGILLYNFAVRLCPKLMSLIWKLFKFVLASLKKLFDHLRRECAKL